MESWIAPQAPLSVSAQSLSQTLALCIDRSVQRFVDSGELGSLEALLAPDVVVRCPATLIVGFECIGACLARLHSDHQELKVETEHFTAARLHTVVFHVTAKLKQSTGRVRLTSTVTLAAREGKVVELWVNADINRAAEAAGSRSSDVDAQVPAEPWAAQWRLTRREQSVAKLAMLGLRDKEVAAALSVEPASATRYLRNVMRKAGARARWELAERAGVVCLG